MPTTPITSIRLSARARAILRALSVKWGYRHREVLERVLQETAAREGIALEDLPTEDKQA